VLENIFRFVEEKQMDGFQAAREATAEIALPVLAILQIDRMNAL
jgi:HAE1 family hydrophobic/amphiphilic exporter-1